MKNISFFSLLILYASCAVNGQRPEDRCQDVGAGNEVCFSCTSVGTCKEDPSNLGKFTIEEIKNCPFTGDFCDKDITDGECFPLGPDSQCSCQIDDECINDPNNENVITVCNPEVVELPPCDVPPAKGECVCPQGSTSTTEGTTTTSEGTTPTFEGTTSTSEGTTSTSEGTTSTSEGTTSTSEGTTSTSEGTTSTSEGTTSTSEGKTSTSEGTTSTSEDTTSTSEGTTSTSEGTTSTSEDTTSTSEGTTPTSEGTTPSETSTPAPNGPTNSNGRPEERCTASGDMVCLSCNSVGSCIELSDGSFVVQPQETCFDPELCDSDFSDGTCLPLVASSTNCFCTGKCRVDINNPLALFLCDTGENILCPIAVDINTCECTDSTPPPTTTTTITPTTLTTITTDPTTTITTPTPLECPSCGFIDFSETDCSRYFYCGGGGLILGLCPGTSCFNPEFCTCG